MKHNKRLWAVATVGILTIVAGTIIRSLTFGMPAHVASKASTALVAIGQRLHGALAHVTTPQLLEAGALAWLVFVLSLILLARSKPNKPPAPRSDASDLSDATTRPDMTRRHKAQVTENVRREVIPPLVIRPAQRNGPVDRVDHQESTSDGGHGHTISGLAAAQVAPSSVAEQRVEPCTQATSTDWTSDGRAEGRSRSHVLALTGVSLADERLQQYGLFIVAEDAGLARTRGGASQRVVEVITEQMAPSLASDGALGSEQFAALLKLSVARASIELRQQSIRSATNLGAVVAGVMVIDDVAHFVNVGDCHTHMFRPGSGLLHVTADHRAMSCRVEKGLPEPESLHMQSQRDGSHPIAGQNQADGDVDAVEINVYPGDLLLLCSSGLWQALRKPQIEAILRVATDARSAADLLAREGTRYAGEQGFSAVVVRPLGNGMAEFGIAASRTHVP